MARIDKHATGVSAARRADRYACYEQAVQNPPADVRFIQRTFRQLRGRSPRSLREDFCGTAALCATWVKLHPENRAIGIDLDARPLDWAIRHHLMPLGQPAARVTLIRRDVREPAGFLSDVVAAFNFSYFTFHDRPALRHYLRCVRRGLKRDGILYLDLYGGSEAMELREEHTAYRGFTYIWDQAAFNPILQETTCHIHFEFPDRSVLRRAFTYHWRLWQIPEVADLAREAGFRACHVYWEGTDHRTGEGNGDGAPAYVVYLVCVK